MAESAFPHTAPPEFPGPDASLDELLAFAGSRYAVEFEQISAGGVALSILQIANMRELLDAAIAENALENALLTLPLWAKIWPASLVLGHAMASLPREHTVLEVGAGCGVAGLVAAALGFSRVWISDINEDALLFARINILKNNLQDRAQVRRVDFSADRLDERFSLILGAEVLYLEDVYRPLVKFFKRSLTPKQSLPRPEVLLATDHRRNSKRFFKTAEKEFQCSHKPIGIRASAEADDADNARPERHLLHLHRLTPLR